MQAFSFKNCGGDFAGLTKLQVIPDPLKLPGNFNISAVGYIKEALGSPLQVIPQCYHFSKSETLKKPRAKKKKLHLYNFKQLFHKLFQWVVIIFHKLFQYVVIIQIIELEPH